MLKILQSKKKKKTTIKTIKMKSNKKKDLRRVENKKNTTIRIILEY